MKCLMVCLSLLLGVIPAGAGQKVRMIVGKNTYAFDLIHHGKVFDVEEIDRVPYSGLRNGVPDDDIASILYSFPPAMLNKIPFVLGRANGIGALATITNGKRYVVHDPHFSGQDNGIELGYAASISFILGHEISHHACGHIRWSNIPLSQAQMWAEELEADQHSAFMLAQYRVETGLPDPRNENPDDYYTFLFTVIAAVKATLPEAPTKTHPPRAHRIQAILAGYKTLTSPCLGRQPSLIVQ